MDQPNTAKDGEYRICCTGDVVVGDEIRFQRATFTGSFRRPRFAGYETITATVIRDSYGEQTQQHTFTLLQADGTKQRIKGRNLYREGVYRRAWADEKQRAIAQQEKHQRGAHARKRRAARGAGA